MTPIRFLLLSISLSLYLSIFASLRSSLSSQTGRELLCYSFCDAKRSEKTKVFKGEVEPVDMQTAVF